MCDFVHVCVHICEVSFYFIVIALIEKEKATEKPKLVLSSNGLVLLSIDNSHNNICCSSGNVYAVVC